MTAYAGTFSISLPVALGVSKPRSKTLSPLVCNQMISDALGECLTKQEEQAMPYTKAAAAIFAASMALSTAPVMAQNVNANNLVNVNISNVANDIAENLSIDVSQVPVTVQVPVGVAANVCDVEANVLAQGGGDAPAECEAQNTSEALNQAVQRQVGG